MKTRPVQTAMQTQPHRLSKLPFSIKIPPGYTLPLIIVVAVLIIIPFISLLGLYIYLDTNQLVFPGVSIGKTDVSWKSFDDSMSAIDRDWNQQKLMVTDGARQWLAAPMDFGIWVDPSATAEQAFQVGHNQRWLHELFFVLSGQTIVIQPVVQFDVHKARALMDLWASQVSVPPNNARLVLQNGQWIAVAGQNGSYLDVDTTLKDIYADPVQILANGFIPLTIRPVAPRISDVSKAEARLQDLLANPLVVRAHNASSGENVDWIVPREVLVTWLRFDEQHGKFIIEVEQTSLDKFLAEKELELGSGWKLTPVNDLGAVAENWQKNEPLVVEVVSG